MRTTSRVRSFVPTLERLESREVLSNIPNVAQQFLVPLAQEFQNNSNAALAQLQKADADATTLLKAANAAPGGDVNKAATIYAQATAGLQDVLTQRRVLEASFVADLHFFQGVIQTEDAATQALDNNTFITVVEPMLNTFRQQVIKNEEAALALTIVNKGMVSTATNGAVSGQTPAGAAIAQIAIQFPALRHTVNNASPIILDQFTYTGPFFPSDPQAPGFEAADQP